MSFDEQNNKMRLLDRVFQTSAEQISGYCGLAKLAHKMKHHNVLLLSVEFDLINQFFQICEFQMLKSLKTTDEEVL